MPGKASTRSTARKLLATAGVLAAVAASLSYGVFSSFSSTADNVSTLNSASFGISADSTLKLPISVSDLLPGDVLTRCIAIKNDGSVGAQLGVKVTYSVSTTPDLSGTATVSVTDGGQAPNTADTSCTDFPTSGTTSLLGSQTIDAAKTATASADTTTPANAASWPTIAAGKKEYVKVVLALPSTATATLAGGALNTTLKFVAVQPQGNANRTS